MVEAAWTMGSMETCGVEACACRPWMWILGIVSCAELSWGV